MVRNETACICCVGVFRSLVKGHGVISTYSIMPCNLDHFPIAA